MVKSIVHYSAYLYIANITIKAVEVFLLQYAAALRNSQCPTKYDVSNVIECSS